MSGIIQSTPYISEIDSLHLFLTKETDDSTRLHGYKTMSESWEHINIDSAIYYARQALYIADKCNDLTEKALINNRLGVLYTTLGNSSQGMHYLQISLSIVKQLNNPQLLAQVYNSIGNVFTVEKDFEKALEHYYHALEINKRINYSSGIANNMNNIAITYVSLNELEKAISYHRQSYELHKQLGDKTGMANTHNNIGVLYFHMNNYDMAIRAFYHVAQIRKELGQNLEYGNAIHNISFVHFYMGEYEKSQEKALESLKYARSTASLPLQRLCLLRLVETSKKLGDFKQAYSFHKEFFIVADSLFNIREQESLIELQSQYFVEKERYEIDLLEKENELIKGNIKRLNYYMAFSGTMVFLLLGFSTIVFFNNRIKTKRNIELEERNQLILNQKKEYELQRNDIRKYNEQLNDQQAEIIKQKEILENKKVALEKAVIELEEKNEKIRSSLRYAGRLQKTMQADLGTIKDSFEEVFVYKKQRHEVFNCFFWFNMEKNNCLLAFVDNHNDDVSGAFMMILINDILNRFAKNNAEINVRQLIEDVEAGIYSSGKEHTDYLSDAFENISLNIINVDMNESKAYFAGKDLPFIHICGNESKLIDQENSIKGSKYFQGMVSLNKDDLIVLPNYNASKHLINKNKQFKPFVTQKTGKKENKDGFASFERVRTFMDKAIDSKPNKRDLFILGFRI